jgi:hypothetical protein
LRRGNLTNGSRHDSFHFISLHFTSFHFISLGFSLERRKEDRWFPPEVCSFWWTTPSRFSG